MNEKSPPIHNVRIGNIKASIWENQNTAGNKFFSTTLLRTYKDEQNQWHESSIYFTDDLPKVELAMRKAFEFIHTQSAERQQPASHTEKVAKERSGKGAAK